VRLGPSHEVTAELGHLRFALRRLGQTRRDADAARAKAAADHALDRLDRLLLAPLPIDGGTGPVVIVPTPTLLAVPWSSLPSLTTTPATVAPSAGLWLAADRGAGRGPGDSVVLAAGPGLAAAAAEVAALAPLHPGAVTLTPPHSTVDAVSAALGGAGLAHLACHGRFRSDNPMFSSLDLADGPLTVHDLERIGRPPRRLILAACDSGVSRSYPGEELVGFLSAVLAAGTTTAVASVVPVPDADTTPLMVAFHQALLAGSSPAVALRDAKGATAGRSTSSFLAATAFTCFGAG
jgi:hypothetical protein